MSETIEERVLAAVREWVGSEGTGWSVGGSTRDVDPWSLVPDLTLYQVTTALDRLRVKGLVRCQPPRPGGPRIFLWFPTSAAMAGSTERGE